MNPQRKATLLGLTAVFFWSTVATAFKLALRELDVWQLLAYASAFSALSLLVLLWWQGGLRLLRAAYSAVSGAAGATGAIGA